MKQVNIYSLAFIATLLVGGTSYLNTNNNEDKEPLNTLTSIKNTGENNVITSVPENVDISTFDSFDEDNVVLSFGAVSDTHLDNATETPTNLLNNAIDYLVELNGGEDLTSLVIGGDLVENTYQEAVGEYTDFKVFTDFIHNKIDSTKTSIFYTMGNHDIDPTQTKGSDCNNVPSNYYQLLTANGHEGYFSHDVNKEDYIADPTSVNGNRHAVINGYHFISISPKYFWMQSEAFTEETMTWFEKTMNSIITDVNYNDEPIFVISHSAIADSVRLSKNDDNVYSDLEAVLNNYPQVIYMGGHIHNIITDELSIEQRGFTMIDLGSTKYTSTFNTLYDKNVNWGEGTKFNNNIGSIMIASGSYVQVDAEGNVKITRFLVNEDESIKGIVEEPWIIPAPKADKSHLLPYNDQYRINNNEAPTFLENDIMFLSKYTKNENTGVRVAIPNAEDDEYVEYYQITLKTVYGNAIYSKYFQTFSYKERVGCPTSDVRIYDFGTVPQGEYVIEVRAGDVWNALSEPLYSVLVVE